MRIAESKRFFQDSKKAAGFASDGLPEMEQQDKAAQPSDETRLVRRENLRDAVFL